MGKANFKFAGAAAVLLAIATLFVAWHYDLPIRDPDGVVVPMYVQLPIIVLLAFLIDVLPRSVYRTWRAPRELPARFMDVVHERWQRSHVAFAIAGLAAWYLSYAAFRNLKSYVPFVNKSLYDHQLHDLDRAIWFGHDPAAVLHSLFGTGIAAQFFSLVYVAWIAMVPVTLAVALVWTRHTTAGSWYVTAVVLDWVLGVAIYFLVPTWGPIYSDKSQFAALPHTYVSTLQSDMWSDRLTVLHDPWATHAVQTIAAFASLHVGVMVTVCLMVELIKLKRWIRISAWVFLVLTEIATIYLGWHFFVDTIGGAALGAAAVWLAAIGTGNHVGLRPRLHQETGAPATSPSAGLAAPAVRRAN
ncbi:MAG: hypothetical protein JWR35_3405 [Marmoricola sp.]|nr:hypothetical protein [Marmoricola sp.]